MGKQLYIISNGRMFLREFADIAGKIHPLATAFHVREKTLSASELMVGVRLLLKAGVPTSKIIINDRVDVAWAVNAGAVQLAGHSLDVELVKCRFPGLRVGRSVHLLDEAVEAERQGADFLLYGHIFPSASKPGLPPCGLQALEEMAKKLRIPVIAIGGITPSNAPQVIRAGAAGVAVMSGILNADDPLSATKEYVMAIHREGGICDEK